MDKDNKETNEFKVVDKRRFNSGGDETGVTDTVKTEQPQAAAKSSAVNNTTSSAKPSEHYAEHAQGEEKIDFVSFIVSLGTQALVMLGEIPNPETRTPSINIEGAKQTIDILGMIAEKTKGNLTPEEDKLFTEILSSLRLAFVKKVGL